MPLQLWVVRIELWRVRMGCQIRMDGYAGFNCMGILCKVYYTYDRLYMSSSSDIRLHIRSHSILSRIIKMDQPS
jgi:hypothetical protein